MNPWTLPFLAFLWEHRGPKSRPRPLSRGPLPCPGDGFWLGWEADGGRKGVERGWKRFRPRPIHLPVRAGAGPVWTPGFRRARVQEAPGPRGSFLECSLHTGQARARPRLPLHIPGAAACPGCEVGNGEVGCDEGRMVAQPGPGG